MNYSNYVKESLFGIIDEMAQYQWLFVKQPERDFTRNRKLSFEKMMTSFLMIEGGSLKKELLDLNQYAIDTATVSAFNQQREKILPEAFQFLFYEFNNNFQDFKTHNGYRLIACDGSSLNIACDPKNEENYFQNTKDQKAFSMLHLNASYDLCSRRYIDAIVQPGKKKNEYRAMCDMIDRYNGSQKAIFIADRGYESYNIFAHAEEKGVKYLIRAKDKKSNGIISSLSLPTEDSFDIDVNLIMTKKQTNEVKAQPQLYKFVPKNSTFDFLDLCNNKFYPLTLRVVRFPITDTTFECIITNLDRTDFSADKIKKLYELRWGIETSFRELKYAIGLTCFHAKKVAYIQQEIFARLVLYNFCEIITTHVAVTKKDTKHTYQLNYTIAIHICKYYLKCRLDIAPPDVEALIQKQLLPIRYGRHDPHKVKPKAVVSFLYRVA